MENEVHTGQNELILVRLKCLLRIEISVQLEKNPKYLEPNNYDLFLFMTKF